QRGARAGRPRRGLHPGLPGRAADRRGEHYLLIPGSVCSQPGRYLSPGAGLAGRGSGGVRGISGRASRLAAAVLTGRRFGRELADLGDAWSRLAAEDPLWAVCVSRAARHGGWDVEAFYATGVAEVEAALARATGLGLVAGGQSALDFGCAVGRLTRPLTAHFKHVTGVDIAPGMLDLARQDNPAGDRCRFVLNDRADLALFGDAQFDLVYSSIVLQH